MLDAFLSVCRWTPIYYTWRPNLKDEADNHQIFALETPPFRAGRKRVLQVLKVKNRHSAG